MSALRLIRVVSPLRRHSVMILLLLAVAASLLHAAASTTADERAASSRDRVARMGGLDVTKAELADFWFTRYPEEYARTLDALLDDCVVRAVAGRLRIAVPRDQLDQAVRVELDARRKQLTTLYGEDVTLEQEVQRAYGMSLLAWERDVLRPRLQGALLQSRIVRLWSRSREVLEVRIIVQESADRARRTWAKLQQGADFSLVAAKASRDPSAKQGGVLPPIARGDLALPGVERRLFAAASGQLVGPLEVRIDGRPQWHIYKVIARRPPWTMTGPALHAALERDLAKEAVSRAEFVRWREGIRRESAVAYFRPDGSPWQVPARR